MLKLAVQDLVKQPFYRVQFLQNEKNAKLKDATIANRIEVGRLVTISLQYKF